MSAASCCAVSAVAGMAIPSSWASSTTRPKSWWSSRAGMPASKVRSTIRSPSSSSILLAANPPISASRTFAGSTPFTAAKSIASATPWTLTTCATWLQSLVTCPAPCPPIWRTCLPSRASSGFTRAKTSGRPPTMIARVAACAPAGPPETGASRCSRSRALSFAAISRVATGDTVAMSTTTVPGRAPSTMPSAPSATPSLSAVAVTIVKTTSALAATSAGDAQRFAPASTWGFVASLRRAHTASECPARRRCIAMGAPMAPSPIQPARSAMTLLVLELGLALLDERAHALLLVLGREERVEEPALEEDPFRERHLVGAVHRLLRHHHRWRRVLADRGRGGERLVEERRRGHYPRHEPHPLGFLRIHHAAGEDHVHRLRLSDRARQPLRPARAGHDADLDLGLPELRRVGGDDDVARERDLAPAAERVAGDRRDHRLAHLLHALPVAGDVVGLVHVHVRPARHRPDVRARGKGLLAAGQNDRADAIVRVELEERVAELVHERVVQRVQLLRPVQRDQSDPAARLGEDVLVGHGAGAKEGEAGIIRPGPASPARASTRRPPFPRRTRRCTRRATGSGRRPVRGAEQGCSGRGS